MAAPGLRSFRYKTSRGWVMIGAHNAIKALGEVRDLFGKTVSAPSLANLQKWNGANYVPVKDGAK